MRAMVLSSARTPLVLDEHRPDPVPGPMDLSIDVRACGVCRTDLHIVDGELDRPKPSLILGHEVVGVVSATGAQVTEFRVGDRVGVPWLGSTCGRCAFCRSGRENLCDRPRFTGYDIDGGYAERAVADARFTFPIPSALGDREAAPLLCAGMIGFRALRLAGPGHRLGLYGFGASAHITAQIARHRGWEVYAFTRPGDARTQEFALGLGAVWAGGSDQRPPHPLDAAVIFAPDGAVVPAALASTAKGGTVVCAGIHMSDVPAFPYRLLWEERVLRSVANLTRQDGREFLAAAEAARVRTTTTSFSLPDANEALARLRAGGLEGAAVIEP